MKKIVSFFNSLHLTRILTVLVLGLALVLTTACNTGNLQGARPENPSVQVGGQNNPYKQGGDGYTRYKVSTDPGANTSRSNAKGGYYNSREYRSSRG